jgi:hypothetical protein
MRLFTFLSVTGVTAAVLLVAPAAGQSSSTTKAKAPAKANGKTWTPPRTADGQIDLQGVWSNATMVPLERPNGQKAEFLSDEEVEVRDKAQAERDAAQTTPGTTADVHYDLTQFGLDRTQTTVASNKRTSLITDPPDGRVPALKPEAQKRQADRQERNRGHQFDSYENRGLAEQCIIWGHVGPPMMPAGYNANLQIMQGPGYVAVIQEMIHDVRIIPLDNRPHLTQGVRQWMGDSRGHWEGDTLIVETTNFTDRTAFRGSSENLRVVERFRRTGPDSISYEFTVTDPSTWERSWTAQYPMAKIEGPLFEYACHEGNYGIVNILSGARAEEREAAAKAGSN